jgi:hypothetical protein
MAPLGCCWFVRLRQRHPRRRGCWRAGRRRWLSPLLLLW